MPDSINRPLSQSAAITYNSKALHEQEEERLLRLHQVQNLCGALTVMLRSGSGGCSKQYSLHPSTAFRVPFSCNVICLAAQHSAAAVSDILLVSV